MSKRSKVFIVVVIVVIGLGVFLVPRLMGFVWLNTTESSKDPGNRLSVYQPISSYAPTDTIFFETLRVPTLPGKLVEEKRRTDSVIQYSFDTSTSTILIFPAMKMDIKGLFPDSATEFEKHQILRGITRKDIRFAPFLYDKKKVIQLILGQTAFSMCESLLAFENHYGTKGTICEMGQEGKSFITVYIDENTGYNIILSGVSRDVRDGVVNGARSQ